MKVGLWLGLGAMSALIVASACSRPSSPGLTAPSGALPRTSDANADGSILKATAPTLISPINGIQLPEGEPVTLAIINSATPYAGSVPLSYRFEVTRPDGTFIDSNLIDGGPGTTRYLLTAPLEGEQTYEWRVRAQYQARPEDTPAAGPWSARQSFVAPRNEGYIRGSQLYDPLVAGRSVGQINGPVTFIPGVGVRLDSPTSYISYQLDQTLTGGEISVLVTNLPAETPGLKTKLFAMAQGYDDLTTNSRRFTVEKRGDAEAGAVAWRVISSEDQIETIGAERRKVDFNAVSTYFWRATWGVGFRLTIVEGGVFGRQIYDFDRLYGGAYDPDPHIVYLGSPPARSGSDNQSIPGATYRQLWVSNVQRPSFANK